MRTMCEALNNPNDRTNSQRQQKALVVEDFDDVVLGVLCFLLVVDITLLDVLASLLGLFHVVLGGDVAVSVAGEEVVGERTQKFDGSEHVRGVEEDGEGEGAGCRCDGPRSRALAGRVVVRGGWDILGLGEDIPDSVAGRFTSLHVGNDVESEAGRVETNSNRLEDGMVAREDGALMAEWSGVGEGDEGADEGLRKVGVDDGLVPISLFRLHRGVLWIVISTGSVVAVFGSGELVAGPSSHTGEK